MKKTCFLIGVIIVLSISSISNAGIITKIHTNAEIIYVDDNNTNGPWDGTLNHPYKNINDGIQNATEGDTIYIFNGTYKENININKRLSLIGEGNTIIDGMYQDYVIHVISNNVVLKDLIIRNSGGYKGNTGILIKSDNNLVIECQIYRTRTGLKIQKGDGNEIKKSVFHTNAEAVKTVSSDKTNIEECVFYHNAYGFDIEHSNDIRIYDCYIHTNGIGVLLNDSANINVSKCAIYNNNDNEGGVMIFFCNNISVFNCNVEHNGFGFKIGDSRDVLISYTDIKNNTHVGLSIETKSENIVIENCNIRDNLRFGIQVYSNQLTIKNSNLEKNLFGLKVEKARCDARGNYWGSFLGPSLFEWKTRDRFFAKQGLIRFIPWRLKEITDAGSDWSIDHDRYPLLKNFTRFEQIKFHDTDSDNDGVPDWWEEKWGYNPNHWDNHANLDPDKDALNNIEECYTDQYGSNPYHKDIFLEIDWMESKFDNISSNKPTNYWVNQMIEVFARRNITLHFDDGRLGGGEQISYKEFYFEDLEDLYWDYFLHNNLNNPRKDIFHYCIISDFGPYPGFPGFSFVGWDNLDSWEISGEVINDNHPFIEKDYLIISVILHELGHTLGLLADDHGGNDNMVATIPFTKQFFKYRSYRSCMNYLYTYRIFDYSDGSHGRNDFDDWDNLDFSFFKNTHFEWPKT